MKRITLLASHLFVMGGAWFVSKGRVEVGDEEEELTLSTRVVGSSGGGVALSDFLESKEEEVSKYELAKGRLSSIRNYPEVVGSLITKLPKGYLRSWRGEVDPERWYQLPAPTGGLIAEFEVRVRQWLSEDREACLKFLREGSEIISVSGNHPVYASAFADYALEEGEEEWVFEVAGGKKTVYQARLAELGVEVFLAKYGGDFNQGGDDLARMYADFGFKDRDVVFGSIVNGEGNLFKKRKALESFLSNDAHQDVEVMAWIRDLRESGAIPGEFKTESDSVFQRWLGKNAEAPVEERLKMSSEISGRRGSLGSMVGEGVELLLNEGRDWGYEFRHGRVQADEVFDDLKKRMSVDSAEGEDALRSHLFYQLVSEDPVRAQALLAPLSEVRRKEVQTRAMGSAFHDEDPLLAKAYFDSFLEVSDAGQRKVLEESWGWQVHFSLRRYGDDFLDWVTKMPDGELKNETVRALQKRTEQLGEGLRKRVRKELGGQ